MYINKGFLLVGSLVLVGLTAQAHPTTQTVVSRPKTDTSVSRPTTNVSSSRPVTTVKVSRPETKTAVSRPTTTVKNSRPETEVEVSRPKTEVSVSRPTTEVSVSRPGEVGAAGGASTDKKAKSTGKKGTAPSAAETKTSMSGYQPPKAKDFSASPNNLGTASAEEQAAKDAAAAAFKVPKAQDPSAANAGFGDPISKDSIMQKVKQKAANRRKK